MRVHLCVIAPRQHSFFRKNVAAVATAGNVLIWRARDLNFRPPAPETNALPFDQMNGCSQVKPALLSNAYQQLTVEI